MCAARAGWSMPTAGPALKADGRRVSAPALPLTLHYPARYCAWSATTKRAPTSSNIRHKRLSPPRLWRYFHGPRPFVVHEYHLKINSLSSRISPCHSESASGPPPAGRIWQDSAASPVLFAGLRDCHARLPEADSLAMTTHYVLENDTSANVLIKASNFCRVLAFYT